MLEELFHISPVDGRYKGMTEEVAMYFSEYCLIKNRVIVEIKWLKTIIQIKQIGISYSEEEIAKLDTIVEQFDITEAQKVKEIELKTKHDVKAVEYYLKEQLKEKKIEKYNPFIHFACTSEDINNLAYGIIMKKLIEEVYIPNMDKLIEGIKEKARRYKEVAMLSHTHGQSATPTTMGKELAIYLYRIDKIVKRVQQEKLVGKFNGTVGNFNAHIISYPDIDWIQISKTFIESFGLESNFYTTQIESHDTIAIVFSEIKLVNNILLDFENDMWMYISRNYFKQKNIKGEIGSSVMPHKINPINFENSMANIKMANGMLSIFIDNLQISRMQRDLSDSSMLRNIGTAIAYTIIAVKQTIIGINKVEINKEILDKELAETPEVLAEAIQTILRKNGYDNAYEILKELTRGKKITIEEIRQFVERLEIKTEDKNVLLELEVQNYIGIAPQLVEEVLKIVN